MAIQSGLPQPVIILGAPRSGTSLLARYLRDLGINMGEQFLPADVANSGGYYEDVDFVGINKTLLAAASGDWLHPPDRKAILAALPPYKNFMAKTVIAKSKQASAWGWKDPRNCITCWAWDGLFGLPSYIWIVRNKSDVINSLERWHPGKPTGAR